MTVEIGEVGSITHNYLNIFSQIWSNDLYFLDAKD